MKRVLALPAAALLLGSTACSTPEVVVEAAIVQESTGETRALADLPIRLLPYDRDAVFDSLEAAAATPEPPIPADLLAAQQTVREAQEAHSQAEARWQTVRDSLRVLSEATQRLSQQNLRGTPQYQQAYNAFNALDPQEGQLRAQAEAAFDRFTSLQEATIERADSVRVVREVWADEAFRDFQEVVDAHLARSGREELADTTNAAGVANFRAPAGQWWVYARYTLPYEELYWNLPVEVTGDGAQVQLTAENAERRPVF